MRLALGLCLLAGLAQAQDFSDYRVERAAGGYRFTEGPVWSRQGYLLFSDIPNQRIHKWVPGAPPTVFRENSNRANGNTFDAQGRLYTCEGGARRLVRTDKRGRVEVLADKWEGKKLNAPNDVVVRRDGQVYFTDPAFGTTDDGRELDFYGVFHISPRGKMEAVAKWKTRPNGIALGADGKILYVANSDQRSVHAFDLDRYGAASNERVAVSGIDGAPDGIKVDEKGNLYVTSKGLAVYSPQGRRLAQFQLQETPSNCAFGDPDFQSLYITARTTVYRIRLNVKGAIQY